MSGTKFSWDIYGKAKDQDQPIIKKILPIQGDCGSDGNAGRPITEGLAVQILQVCCCVLG